GLSVAVQAAVLEPLPGGTDGLCRSWALTKGFRWRAFGLYVVVIVLLSLFLIGFGVIAGLAAALLPVLFVPALIGVGLIFLFFYPFSSCVFTLFYYDLRVRKEAFDLELLSQHLGIAPAVLAQDRKSTRLNSSHVEISYAVFCLKKKKKQDIILYIIHRK